jgi:Mrp family chromosome partitioning ATPase
MNFELLRARIESTVSQPGVVVVTSAMRGDGKSAVAHGLATALGSAGYRTLLIDAGVQNDGIIQPPTGASMEDILFESARESTSPKVSIAALTSPALRRESSLPSVSRALAAVRGSYDYVVADAGCALESALAAHFVTSADAVLVAVRAGRRLRGEDARLRASLERLDAQFFAAVAVSPAVIDSQSTLVKRAVAPVREVQNGHVSRESLVRNVRPRIEL